MNKKFVLFVKGKRLVETMGKSAGERERKRKGNEKDREKGKRDRV